MAAFNRFSRRYFRKRKNNHRSRSSFIGSSYARRLRVEELEDRRLLAVFSVSNLDDAGPGSLRDAIATANSNGEADTIDFSVQGTVNLDSQLPTITDDLTIDGGNQIILDAGGGTDGTIGNGDGYRIFSVNDGSGSLIDVEIRHLTLTGADTSSGAGAIINLENLTIFESTITGNRGSLGGAIETSDGNLNILGSTISGNSANNGSAIEHVGGNGTVNISNSTISGNTTTAGGNNAAIHNFAFRGGQPLVTINNSTIADSGANAIWNRGPGSPKLVLNNTLFTDPVLQQSGTLTGDNNIFTTTGSTTGGANDIITSNALIGPLADNAGPTLTHALLPNSPAIDAGMSSESTDQRSFNRSVGAGIDIGAFERQATESTTLVVSTNSDVVDGNYSPSELSLREAISLTNDSLGPDTITFDVSGTITLNSSLPRISDDLTITATNSKAITIDGGGGTDGTVGNRDGFRLIRVNDFDSANQIKVTLDGLVLTGGDRDNGNGGAILNNEDLTVINSMIIDNAAQTGGGVLNDARGTLLISQSTVAHNQAIVGGGIDNRGLATIANSTISSNETTEEVGAYGGGISNSETLAIIGSTIARNEANSTLTVDAGGGIFNSATLALSNSIVASNLNGDIDGDGTVTGSNNLIQDSSGGLVDTISGDPMLGPLANNGGPTLTHALLPGSPAIDAGGPLASTFDQRGAPFFRLYDDPSAQRPPGGNFDFDIGAYERQTALGSPFPLVVDTAADESDGDYSAGDLSLREAIGLANGSVGPDTITFDPTVFSGGASSLIRLTAGELEITESLTIDASAGTDVTISGDALGNDMLVGGSFITDVAASGASLLDDNSRVLNFTATSGNLRLSNLTITGGRTTGDDKAGGGVVFGSDGNFDLINSSVSGNSTAGRRADGGGIHSEQGKLFLSASNITGNSTSGDFSTGGAISAPDGFVQLSDSEVSGNYTNGTRAQGGGIYTNSADVNLFDSIISDNSTSGTEANGGGIYSSFGNVEIRDSTISDNSTSGGNSAGGGIAVFNGGTTTLVNSTVTGNRTAGDFASGGAIFARHNLILMSSEVIGNHTMGDSADGGGIFSFNGILTLDNSTVSGNSTAGFGAEGGGISTDSGSVMLDNSTVSGNSTSGNNASGGGIFTIHGTVSLIGSTIRGNSTAGNTSYFVDYSTSSGGGIATTNGNVTLSSSTVSGNSTSDRDADGGGIFTTNGSVSLTNSTVSGNSASGYGATGGGISTVFGEVTLTSSTITGNEAARTGGGVYVSNRNANPSFAITNSIVAGNTDNGTAPELRPDPDSTLTVNHSLIGINTGSGLLSGMPDANGNLIGTSASPIDPMLGPLADNGGPTQTHMLRPGSVAIDAGDPSISNPPQFDQRGVGFNRLFNGRIDIGAVEGPPHVNISEFIPISVPDSTPINTIGQPTIYESLDDNDPDKTFVGYFEVELTSPVLASPGILLNFDVTTTGGAVLGEDFYVSQLDLSTTADPPPITNAIFVAEGESSGRIYVTALSDAVKEDLQTVTITLTPDVLDAQTSFGLSSAGYQLGSDVSKTIHLVDNSNYLVGFALLNQFGEDAVTEKLIVNQDTGEAKLFVKLTSNPGGVVTINVGESSSQDPGNLDTSVLTFNADNWDVLQSVTVSGLAGLQGKVTELTISSSTLGELVVIANVEVFDSLETIKLNVKEGGSTQTIVPTVSIQKSTDATEGDNQPGTFTVSLDVPAPEGGLRVYYELSAGASGIDTQFEVADPLREEESPNRRYIEIPAGELSSSILIAAIDDNFVDGTFPVEVSVVDDPATDPKYQVAARTAELNVIDNDVAGIQFATLKPVVDGSADVGDLFSFQVQPFSETANGAESVVVSVRLNEPPNSNVVLTLKDANNSSGPSSLTFTAENYDSAQTTTLSFLRAADDNGFDLSATTSTSSGGPYADLDLNLPFRQIASTFDSQTLLTTSEDGSELTFGVRLTSEPISNVTLALESSDGTEGKIEQTPLTFDSGNWEKFQVVTATGLNDSIRDGDQIYVISASGGNYSNATFPILNQDTTSAVDVPTFNNSPIVATLVPVNSAATESGTVEFKIRLNQPAPEDLSIFYRFTEGSATETDLDIPAFSARSGEENPFFDLNVNGYESLPSGFVTGDIDLDGDLDALVTSLDGGVEYFANIGSTKLPDLIAGEILGLPEFASKSSALGDLDGDGDLDLLLQVEGAAMDGSDDLLYFQNQLLESGNLEFVEVSGAASPFRLLNGELPSPIGLPNYRIAAIGNFGGGPEVILSGQYEGQTGSSSQDYTFVRYAQINPLAFNGQSTGPIQFSSIGELALEGFDRSVPSKLTIADWDGDRDSDILVGSFAETGGLVAGQSLLYFAENLGGTFSTAKEVRLSGTDSSFGGTIYLSLADINGDEILDLLVAHGGSSDSLEVSYLEGTRGQLQEVVVPEGMSEVDVEIQITDDEIDERDEELQVSLVSVRANPSSVKATADASTPQATQVTVNVTTELSDGEVGFMLGDQQPSSVGDQQLSALHAGEHLVLDAYVFEAGTVLSLSNGSVATVDRRTVVNRFEETFVPVTLLGGRPIEAGTTLDINLSVGAVPLAADAPDALLAVQDANSSVLGLEAGTRLQFDDGSTFVVGSSPLLPSVVVGDYDENGTTNGSDFLTWQRNFGASGAGLAADGNNNGLVDAADLQLWELGLKRDTRIDGDYDSSGNVAGNDFLSWQRSFGVVGQDLAADGNRNGIVNQADLEFWQANFGSTSPVNSTLVTGYFIDNTLLAASSTGENAGASISQPGDYDYRVAIKVKATSGLSFDANATQGSIRLQIDEPLGDLSTMELPAGTVLAFSGGARVIVDELSEINDSTDVLVSVTYVAENSTSSAITTNDQSFAYTFTSDSFVSSITLTIEDNDTAQVIREFTEGSDTTTSEEGDEDTIVWSLNSQPTAPVRVILGVSNDEALLSTAEMMNQRTVELLFTPLNWNVGQTVTVTGQDDDIVESFGGTEFRIVTTLVSEDPNYNDDNIVIAPAKYIDFGDTNTFELQLSSLFLDSRVIPSNFVLEFGNGAKFINDTNTEALSQGQPTLVTGTFQPTDISNLEVGLRLNQSTTVASRLIVTNALTLIDGSLTSGELDLQLDPSQHVANVTLLAGKIFTFANGARATLNENVTLSDTSPATVKVTLLDQQSVISEQVVSEFEQAFVITSAFDTIDDTPTGTIGFQIEDSFLASVSLREGAVFDFRDGARAHLDFDETFTNGVEKTVDLTVNLNALNSHAEAYIAEKELDLTFVNIDNDTAGFELRAYDDTIAISEGNSNNFFTAVLKSEPLYDVVVTLTPSNDRIKLRDEIMGESLSITFNAANWDIPQTIEVTAIDDDRVEFDHSSDVTATISSDDFRYNNSLVSNSVRVFIEDNDLPIASVKTVAGAIEANAPGYFVVTLDHPVPNSPETGETGIVVNYTISGTADTGESTPGNTADTQPIRGSVRIGPGESRSPLIAFPIDDFKAEGVDLIVTAAYSDTMESVELEIDAEPFVLTSTFSNGKIGLRLAGDATDGETTILSKGTTLLFANGASATVSETTVVGEENSVLVSLDEDPGTTVVNQLVHQQIDLPEGTELQFPGGTIVTTTNSRTVTNRMETSIEAELTAGSSGEVARNALTKLQGESVVVTLDAGDRYEVGDADSAGLIILDNDKPGIRVISPTGTVTAFEDATSGELMISLLSQPEAPVTINISEVMQTSRILEVATPYDSQMGTIGLKLNDPTGSVDSLELPAGTLLFGTTVSTAATLFSDGRITDVILVSDPTDANVGMTDSYSYDELRFADGSDMLTFDSTNWFILQTVTIEAIDDNVVEEGSFHTKNIQFTVGAPEGVAPDPNYAGFEVPNQTVNIVDRAFDTDNTYQSLTQGFLALQDSLDKLELPILGNFGEIAPPFIDTFVENLSTNIRQTDNLTTITLTEAFNGAINSSIGVEGLTFEVTSISAEEMTFLLNFSDSYITQVSLESDLGLEALNIGIESMGTIDFEVGYDVNLAFGISKNDLFFIDTEETSFSVEAGVTLSDTFRATGQLGFLQLDITNPTEGDRGTGITADFVVTLEDIAGDTTDNRISLEDLTNSRNVTNPFSFISYGFSGNAVLDLDLTTSVSGSAAFPSFSFNLFSELPLFNYGNEAEAGADTAPKLTVHSSLEEEYTGYEGEIAKLPLTTYATEDVRLTKGTELVFTGGSVIVERTTTVASMDTTEVLVRVADGGVTVIANDSVQLESGAFNLAFRDITLDLGTFATDLLGPLVTTINDVVEPFKPIIEVLDQEIEFIKEIGLTSLFDEDGDGRVTLIEIAFSLSPGSSSAGFSRFASAITGIVDLAETLSALGDNVANGENLAINFGDYELQNFKGASANTDAQGLDLNMTPPMSSNMPATSPEKQTMETGDASVTGIFNKLDRLGIKLDVIENPLNVIRLFLGQDIDLVTWDVPELDLSFNVSQSFPIWTPPTISGVLGGSFRLQSDLVFGYDTFGLRQWSENDFSLADSYRVFDGFYLSDVDPVTGEDVNELTFEATITAGAKVSAVVATVTARGGIQGLAGLDIVDVGETSGTSDGRIRGSEFISRITDPLSLFNVTGQIDVFFDLAVSVGLDAGFIDLTTEVVKIEFARFTLFEFQFGGGGNSPSASISASVASSNIETEFEPFAAAVSPLEKIPAAPAVLPISSTNEAPTTSTNSVALPSSAFVESAGLELVAELPALSFMAAGTISTATASESREVGTNLSETSSEPSLSSLSTRQTSLNADQQQSLLLPQQADLIEVNRIEAALSQAFDSWDWEDEQGGQQSEQEFDFVEYPAQSDGKLPTTILSTTPREDSLDLEEAAETSAEDQSWLSDELFEKIFV